MKAEKIKRVFFDAITAALSWLIFFYYRKEIIEQSTFIISETLIYGLIGVTIFWLIVYFFSGNYEDVQRVSRLGELYRTAAQSILGCLIIFFFLIIDDIENYQSYKFYYTALTILASSHFTITFTARYLITYAMVQKYKIDKYSSKLF